jgi:hypothetical protein
MWHYAAASPPTAFEEIAPPRLAAGEAAVGAVGGRELRQEGEGLTAKIAEASPNRNPIMVLAVSVFAAAAMADNRVPFTNGAPPQDDLATDYGPIAFQLLWLGGKWDKKNRGKGALLRR